MVTIDRPKFHDPFRHPVQALPSGEDDTLTCIHIEKRAIPYLVGAVERLISRDAWAGSEADIDYSVRVAQLWQKQLQLWGCDGMDFCARVLACIHEGVDGGEEGEPGEPGPGAPERGDIPGNERVVDTEDLDCVWGATESAWDVFKDYTLLVTQRVSAVLGAAQQFEDQVTNWLTKIPQITTQTATAIVNATQAITDTINQEVQGVIELNSVENAVRCAWFCAIRSRGSPYTMNRSDVRVAGMSAFVEAMAAESGILTEAVMELYKWLIQSILNYDQLMFTWALNEEICNNNWEALCPCGNWVHTFDFSAGDGGWTPNNSVTAYNAGCCWEATGEDASSPGADVSRGFADAIVTRVEVALDLQCGSLSSVSRDQILFGIQDGVEQTLDSQSKTCAPGVDFGTEELIWNGNLELDGLRVHARIGGAGSGAHAQVKQVKIYGTGNNPFGA